MSSLYTYTKLPNWANNKPVASRRWFTIAGGATLTLLLLSLIVHLSSPGGRRITPVDKLWDSACDLYHTPRTPSDEIPNIVHYVWLPKNPEIFSLNFKVFLTVYSSHIFLKPDHIYIHTDASPDIYEKAKATGDLWTKRILNIPKVTPNYIKSPTKAKNGVPIVKMEQKSDFLRMQMLREFGGLYLDMDAIPLRSVDHLRKTGFANVVGGAHALNMHDADYLNGGVWLAKPNSLTVEIMSQAAQQFWDGDWNTVGPYLITDVANQMAVVPGEVLILQPEAFAPFSHLLEDQERLFRPYASHAIALDDTTQNWSQFQVGGECKDVLQWLKQRKLQSWEMDWSHTYVLHAFDNDLNSIAGWNHKIDVNYILARQSNYARALYPTIKHALDAGIVKRGEF